MIPIDFILLIDDDEATGVFHRIMAEEAGLTDRIYTTQSAEAALKQLTELVGQDNAKHGLIFLDINMPVHDGWDFLNMLEASALDAQQFHVIMVSASDHPKDIDRIMAHPLLKGFEPKPITSEKILFWADK
jgi:CheY-like chemotaxis protein